MERASPKTGWHPADIVAAVKKMGTSLRRLGLSNGFAESTLRASLHKQHPRAQRLIAQAIGVSLHELWPGWYDPAGNRIPMSRARAARLRTKRNLRTKDNMRTTQTPHAKTQHAQQAQQARKRRAACSGIRDEKSTVLMGAME